MNGLTQTDKPKEGGDKHNNVVLLLPSPRKWPQPAANDNKPVKDK
jgi:hypothetical protein